MKYDEIRTKIDELEAKEDPFPKELKDDLDNYDTFKKKLINSMRKTSMLSFLKIINKVLSLKS